MAASNEIINQIIIQDESSSHLPPSPLPSSPTNNLINQIIIIDDNDNDNKGDVWIDPNVFDLDQSVGPFIGSHICKLPNQSMYDCLSSFCENRKQPPCQMFLRSPMNGRVASSLDLSGVRDLIKHNKLRYYTHAPYIINLSNPTTKKNPTSDAWIMGLLTKDLIDTNSIGGKGVVVHVGKACKMNVNTAVDTMERYIRKALINATEKCPLLLETAAGQGTEICTSFDDLSSFYSRFDAADRKVFKICVDTCHIFSAGYDPLDFLEKWESIYPKSIGLVHFNDSKREKGARVDRHSYYTSGGFIGIKRLMEVATWCIKHDISIVTE